MKDTTTSRRQLITATAIGAVGVTGLAGCSRLYGDDQAATVEPGAAATTEPPSADEGSGGASGETLASVDDVPVGGALAAKNEAGDDIIIAQPKKGKFVAFSAACTHQGCTVKIQKKKLVCPCHGSTFKATTGAVLNGPATDDLPKIDVDVDGDDIVSV